MRRPESPRRPLPVVVDGRLDLRRPSIVPPTLTVFEQLTRVRVAPGRRAAPLDSSAEQRRGRVERPPLAIGLLDRGVEPDAPARDRQIQIVAQQRVLSVVEIDVAGAAAVAFGDDVESPDVTRLRQETRRP